MRAFVLLSAFFFVSNFSLASSEIPDRREFPVNTNVNPCENFYEYACSKVISNFTLRDDRSSHTFSFNDSHERLLDYKKKYFAGLKDAKPASKKESMIRNSYLACMSGENRAKEEKELIARIQKELSEIKTNEQFQKFVGKHLLSPELSIVGFGTLPNQNTPDWNDIVLDTSLMSLPEKTYYDKTDVVDDLEKLFVAFFETVGAENPKAKAKEVMDFEKGLAKTYPTPQEFRTLYASKNSISRKDLLSQYKNLHLTQLMNEVPGRTGIRHFIPASMKYLNDELATLPLEAWKSVYLYHAVSEYMDDAYPEFFQKKFQFRKKHMGGPEKRPERDERCTRMVMDRFEKEVDYILTPRLFNKFPTQKFVSLAEAVRKSLLHQLEENTWLSKEAKKEAIRKIKTAKLQLVTPKNTEEWDFVDEANYSETTPIANYKKFGMLSLKKDLRELKNPVSKLKWSLGPLTINAYYTSAYNKFVLPVGILQYPFYDTEGTLEQNLGAIGAVIGHELGHAIDDKGSKFDADGKLRDWMKDQDLAEFKKRTGPMIAQFNAIGHNGELTLGENIGDLVGVSTAYRAAFVEGKPKGDVMKLKRDFFTQYARAWCTVERPKYSELRLKTDPHSLGHARVNEQVKHQPAFAEAFGCKKDDPLTSDAAKRVIVW